MTTNPTLTSTHDKDSAEQTRILLQPVLADLATVAGAVTDQQRSLPTPCPAYDVAALTGHIVGWLENFAGGFASADGTCPSAEVSTIHVSTGQSWSPAPEAAHAAREFLETMVTPEYRGPDGMFGLEVPVADAAPAIDRLVGFAGRDPHWSTTRATG